MNKLYSKKSQKSTVTALLGGVTSIEGETIIQTSSSGTDYFAKGHLSPDAAFVYNVLQDATYYFVNVAPQVERILLKSSLFDKYAFSVPIIQQRQLEGLGGWGS